MKKTSLKLIFDAVMAAILVLLYEKNVISLAFHEAAGLTVCLFVVFHLLFNRKWISAVTTGLFKKETPVRTKICYSVDLLLCLDFLCILVTGIGVSKKILAPLAFLGGKGVPFHMFFGALSIILVGIHVGLHWNLIRKTLVKKPIGKIAAGFSAVVLALALVFGGYSLATSHVPLWLTLPFNMSEMPARPMPAPAVSPESSPEKLAAENPALGQGAVRAGSETASPERKRPPQPPVTAGSVSLHILRFLSMLILVSFITAVIDWRIRKARK